MNTTPEREPSNGRTKPEIAPTTARERAGGPRRVRAGLKIRSRSGEVPSTVLSDAWLELVASLVPESEHDAGHEYARLGQIVSLAVEPGAVVSEVQGRRARPYHCRIELGAFTESEWDRIVSEMASEAVFMVKLLADEVPELLDQRLRGFGLSLLPDVTSVRARCDCDIPGPCKHVSASGWILAEALANDPLKIFAIRGMAADHLLERLRQARALRAHGMVAAHVDPVIPETQAPVAPLGSCVEDFWNSPAPLSRAEDVPAPHHVTHALLRRLGPSPLAGRFPLSGLLASIYDTVAEHATRMRDRDVSDESASPKL